MPRADDYSRSAEISVSPTTCGASGIPVRSIRSPENQSMTHRPFLIPDRGAYCLRPLSFRTTLLPVLVRRPGKSQRFRVCDTACRRRRREAGRTGLLEDAQVIIMEMQHQEEQLDSIRVRTACRGNADEQAWDVTRRCGDARPA
jgi:hypothetical protein